MIPPMGSKLGEGRSSSSNFRGSRIVFAVVAVLAALLLWQGGLFRPAKWNADPGNSVQLFPGIVLCLIIASAVWLAVVGDGQSLQSWSFQRLMMATALTTGLLLFVQLFSILGWALSSGIMLVTLPLALGYRSASGIVIFGLPILILVWLVFIVFMGIQLPTGTIFQ